METPQNAPDLKDGFMVNGIGTANRWTTEIRSVVEERGTADGAAYLSQECRVENVPFMSADPDSGGPIFDGAKPWEFVVYLAGSKTCQISTADIEVVEQNLIGAGQTIDEMVVPSTLHEAECLSEAVCSRREIREISYAEALTALQHDRLNLRDTFMKVSWSRLGKTYDLYCPCRYINYPDPERGESRYLQPISGYVLVPLKDDVYVLAYVAAATDFAGRTVVEFNFRRYRNAFMWLAARAEATEGSPGGFGDLARQLPLLASCFDGILRPEDPDFMVYAYA